jgi:O-antigen/teichoic acid export membrane protein
MIGESYMNVPVGSSVLTDRVPSLLKRARPLMRLASQYTVAYMATKLLAALSSLWLVRLLPVEEYGFYTLMLTTYGFICTSSDMGATGALSYFRWRVTKSGKSWEPYLLAVMRFRRMIFMMGFSIAAVYVYLTASHMGVAAQAIVPNIAIMGLGAWLSIHSGIISCVLKLGQRFRAVYMVEVSNETAKLLMACAIWASGMATAFAGISGVALGAGIAAILATKFRRQTQAHGNENRYASRRWVRHSNRALLGQILPTLPGTIHFYVQGILVLWLAAYFGSSTNLAEIGALGRLCVIVGLIAGFTDTVLVPRLVAVQDKAVFFRHYLLMWLMQVLSGGGIILVVAVFPSALLYLLGSSYSGLDKELLVAAVTTIIATWGGFTYSINRVRGWTKYQPWSVPVIVAGQVALFLGLDFSTTLGVLMFSMGSFLVSLMYQILLSFVGFYSINKK